MITLLKKKPTLPPRNKNIYNMWESPRIMSTGYHSTINWADFNRRLIQGFYNPCIYLGDEMRSKTKNDKIYRFEVIKIKYPDAKRETFFATVKDIGYLNESIEHENLH